MRPFILLLVIGVVLVSVATFVYTTASSRHQGSSPEASSEPETPTVPAGWKQFTDAAMNITFDYPQAFRLTRLTQITPQLVSLSDPTRSGTEEALFIYSTATANDANDFDVSVPFSLPGQLKQTRQVQLQGFQGLMNVYGDKTKQVQVLLLKQGKQFFAIRYPAQEAIDQAVVEQIINSIALLH
jgi:hypothetical protein